ncbi:putative integral membrane protein [Acanthocheilonema viteae]
MATIRPPLWCISKIPILKWLQLVCSFIVAIFLSDGRYQWFVYTVIFFISIFLIVCTFLTLVVLCMGMKNIYNIEVIFNLVAFSLCLMAGSVLTYDLIKMISGSFTHHQYLPPTHIGRDSWMNRIAVCTVFLLLKTLFYQASFVLTKHMGRDVDQ